LCLFNQALIVLRVAISSDIRVLHQTLHAFKQFLLVNKAKEKKIEQKSITLWEGLVCSSAMACLYGLNLCLLLQ
jgi:hypothetical protein